MLVLRRGNKLFIPRFKVEVGSYYEVIPIEVDSASNT